MRGIETELDWRVTDEWSSFANYTYNESEIREYTTNPAVEGNYLPYTPHQKLGLGLSYANPELFDFKVLLNYKDRRYADNDNTSELESYYTLDLVISRQFGRYCKFSLRVENLFDEDYTVYKGTDQDTVAPGRVITVSANIKF